jgi:carbon-monoxide dehydrogenase large subunit
VVFENGDRAAVEAAFAAAAFRSDLKVVSQRLIPAPMEPRAVQAWHEAATGLTHVRTPTQGVSGMLGFLSAITGWPVDSIRVHTQDVGGSFGLRGTASPEHALLMLAARQLGRPVRWVSSRSETFLSDWHGRALTLHGHIALDAQGRILALRFENQVDAGAFNVYYSTHIGARNLSITMGGVYKVPALHMQSHIFFTNTVPVSAYRGAGRPDVSYAIERLVDHAAHEHGFDPVALRRLNFIAPADFPYTTANGTVYDNGDFSRVMDQVLAQSDAAGVARGVKARARAGCCSVEGWPTTSNPRVQVRPPKTRCAAVSRAAVGPCTPSRGPRGRAMKPPLPRSSSGRSACPQSECALWPAKSAAT